VYFNNIKSLISLMSIIGRYLLGLTVNCFCLLVALSHHNFHDIWVLPVMCEFEKCDFILKSSANLD